MDYLTSATICLLATIFALVHFRKKLVAYWIFRQKCMKLPTIKYNFFLGHLIHIMVPVHKIRDVVVEILKTAPPVVFLWFGPVACTGVYRARDVEEMLTNPNCTQKAFFYKFLEPWLGDGLLLSSGSKWHSRRKLLTPGFHFSILENFVEVFARKSRILVENLKRELGNDSFEVTRYVSMCTLDGICETAMGVEINAQDMEKDSEYVNAISKISVEIMNRIFSPWLYPDFIYYLTPSGRRFKNYCNVLHTFTKKVIRDRAKFYAQKKKNRDEKLSEDKSLGIKRRVAFLDLLLEASLEGANLSEEDIREEVDTFMFEGHDTTTSALTWALQLLGRHPHLQEIAYKEQESIFGDSDREPTMKDLNEMKYLERVIKETLRMYPSVPMLGRNNTEDVTFRGDIVIPKGVLIGSSFYYLHRDEEFFPDPDTFDPDRFLPENSVNRHPFAYVPFSAGPRNCIGQRFAMMEMKMILAHVLRSYKVIATREDPEPLPELVTRAYKGIHLRILQRSNH